MCWTVDFVSFLSQCNLTTRVVLWSLYRAGGSLHQVMTLSNDIWHRGNNQNCLGLRESLSSTDMSNVMMCTDINWYFAQASSFSRHSPDIVHAVTPLSLGIHKRWWSWHSNAPSVSITCSFHYAMATENLRKCQLPFCNNSVSPPLVSAGCLLSPTMPCLISPPACRADLTPLIVGEEPLDSRMVGEWWHGLLPGVEEEEQTKS